MRLYGVVLMGSLTLVANGCAGPERHSLRRGDAGANHDQRLTEAGTVFAEATVGQDGAHGGAVDGAPGLHDAVIDERDGGEQRDGGAGPDGSQSDSTRLAPDSGEPERDSTIPGPDATPRDPDAAIPEVVPSVSTADGNLTIAVTGAGPRAETRNVTDSFPWAALDPAVWTYDPAADNWRLSKPLTSYPSGKTYELCFRNPDTERQRCVRVAIPIRPVVATWNAGGGHLTIEVSGAGPNGVVMRTGAGGFDWTPFLTTVWTFNANRDIWRLSNPLSGYPAGASYEFCYRNPDTGRQTCTTITLPN
jgi:hypothetical protein